MILTNQHFFSSVCENKCCLVIMNFTKKHIFDIEGVQTMDGSQIITYLHG